MPFEQGTPSFGLSDAKVQTWGAASYTGTLTDIMGIQMATATLQIISAIANGDDAIIAAAARVSGAQLQMRFVGMNPLAVGIITGVSVDASSIGTGSSVSNLQFVGGSRLPYFGAIVKALSEEVGDTWVFLPKCKIMSDFVLFQGEYGAFSTPEVTVQCVPDTKWGVANFITHPTDTAITTMPPANISSL